MLLLVTLKSPSPLTVKFISQAACAFQPVCKHTAVKTCYLLRPVMVAKYCT